LSEHPGAWNFGKPGRVRNCKQATEAFLGDKNKKGGVEGKQRDAP